MDNNETDAIEKNVAKLEEHMMVRAREIMDDLIADRGIVPAWLVWNLRINALSMRQLGIKTDISNLTISRISQGKKYQVGTIRKLAEFLGYDTDLLLAAEPRLCSRKLTQEDIDMILVLVNENVGYATIARIYNVSRETIRVIANRQTH